MKFIAEVVIHKYIRNVVMTQSQRVRYYKSGEKLPKKWVVGKNCLWLENNKRVKVLCDNTTFEPIIKNPRSAGTQKLKRINGQDLHALTMQDYERSKIVKAIKAQMIPEVAKLEPINLYPIRILAELHDTYNDALMKTSLGKTKEVGWDVDNRGLFYCKTFPDVLSGCLESDADTGFMTPTSKVIIPDDNRRFITQPPVVLFCPIEDSEQRKLIFKIYHDDREIITNNKSYAATY